MSKVIYFTAGAVPTTAEKLAIAALNARAAEELTVSVRNGLASNSYGAGIESADYVMGTRPAAYSSTETFPALPDTIGDIAQNAVVTVKSGELKSKGTLTIAEPVTAGDTMTVGATVYTFVTGATTAAGEIGLGGSEAATKLAIVEAINGTDGKNTANASASAAAFSGDACVLTAKAQGTAGDAVVTTETFTHVSNVFDAATLGTTQAGVDSNKSVSGTAEVVGESLDHVDLPGTAAIVTDTQELAIEPSGSFSTKTTVTVVNGVVTALVMG
jgi:hypothetical protein